jgi:hypothetical protein
MKRDKIVVSDLFSAMICLDKRVVIMTLKLILMFKTFLVCPKGHLRFGQNGFILQVGK